MKKIVVLGATSDIAKECIKIWVTRGDKVFLVARNQENLIEIIHQYKNYSENINYFITDLKVIDNHKIILDKALDFLVNIDLVFLAYAEMPEQESIEFNYDKIKNLFLVNSLSVISLLNLFSQHMKTIRHGHIGLISTAGSLRGKASNYIYGSSKALLNHYISGLRQHLFKKNIHISLILPGFTNSKMTKNFKKNFIWSNANLVAKNIVDGLDRKKEVIYTPYYWRFINWILNLIPENFFKKLDL